MRAIRLCLGLAAVLAVAGACVDHGRLAAGPSGGGAPRVEEARAQRPPCWILTTMAAAPACWRQIEWEGGGRRRLDR